MDNWIQSLPRELAKEIFSFLIPDVRKITFEKAEKGYYYNYSNDRYENAYVNDELCKNEKGYYLSRIPKKNGKHRYYITCAIEDVVERECNDRIHTIFMYEYESTYVGKNIEYALLALLYNIYNISNNCIYEKDLQNLRTRYG